MESNGGTIFQNCELHVLFHATEFYAIELLIFLSRSLLLEEIVKGKENNKGTNFYFYKITLSNSQ